MLILKLSKVSNLFLLTFSGGGGAAAGGSKGNQQTDNFSKMKEQMGMFAGKPMTRDEAIQILGIELEDSDDELDPEVVMERFETLIEKN